MINQELVNKIHCLLDKGIISGINPYPKPGEMCLEQAICYALGEKITDRPSCVSKEVGDFVISLNNQEWSSPSARAEGMRDLAIAQLRSTSLDQKNFLYKLSFALITKMLPAMFRDLGEERWEKEIQSLEEAESFEEARQAAHVAYASRYTSYVDAAFLAVRYAVLYADSIYIPHYAVSSAYYAADATNTGDKYLKVVSHLAVEVLKEINSPSCKFLNTKDNEYAF